jgi:hypothetical protein
LGLLKGFVEDLSNHELRLSNKGIENSLGIEHNFLSQDLELVAEEEPASMLAKAVMPG